MQNSQEALYVFRPRTYFLLSIPALAMSSMHVAHLIGSTAGLVKQKRLYVNSLICSNRAAFVVKQELFLANFQQFLHHNRFICIVALVEKLLPAKHFPVLE